MMHVSCWIMLLCLITPSMSNFSLLSFAISSAANIVLSSSEMAGILQYDGRSFAVLDILMVRVLSMKYLIHL